MTPHEFLNVLVDAVVDRLQHGESVGLPGLGHWARSTNDPRRVEFRTGDSAATHSAVLNLARAISRRTGHDAESAATGLVRFAASARREIESAGQLDLPGVGVIVGLGPGSRFEPSDELLEAVAWQMDVRPPKADPADVEMADEAIDPPVETIDAAIEASRLPRLGAEPARVPRVHRVPQPSHTPTPERRRSIQGGLLILLGIVAVVVSVTAIVLLRRVTEPRTIEPRTAEPRISVVPESTAVASRSAAGDSLTSIDSSRVAGVVAVPGVSNLPVAPTVIDPGPDRTPPDRPSAAAPASGSGDFDTTRSGFTLITASTTDAAEARTALESNRGFGHPVAVLAYSESGTTRFRVAVGTFPTLATADSVRMALVGRLPDGTWIRRIRP